MNFQTLVLPDVRTLASVLRAKLCRGSLGVTPARTAFASPSPLSTRCTSRLTGACAPPPAIWSSTGTTPTLKIRRDGAFSACLPKRA